MFDVMKRNYDSFQKFTKAFSILLGAIKICAQYI